MGGRTSRIALLVVVALVAGCGSSGPSGSNSVAGLTGGPVRAGLLDPTKIAPELVTPPSDPDKLSASAAALGSADRTEVKAAAVFGTPAEQLQTLMDQAQQKALQDLEAKLKGSASSGAFPVELMSYARPSVSAQPKAGSVLLTISFLLMVGLGGVFVGGFDPRVSQPPVSQTVQEEQTSGPASVSLTATMTGSSSGGVVSVKLDMSGNGQTTNSQTGAVTTLTGSTSYAVSLNPCPDPGGLVSGHIDIADDEAFAGGDKTVGYQYQGAGDFVTQVNDQAEIATTKVTTTMDRGVTTYGSSAGTDTHADVQVTASDTFGPNGSTVAGNAGSFVVDKTDGPATVDDVKQLGGAIGTFMYGSALYFSLQAKSVWQGGRCFEVRPAPDGGSVTTASKTSVKVTVYHWVDKAEIKVPVIATLAGNAAIDPSNQPITSPATFQFTAGKPGSTGDVTYKVTSNRGIAQKVSNFKVTGDLKVDITGTLVETASISTYNLKIQATGIVIHLNPDNSVFATGQATVTGTVTAYICHGTINEKIQVNGTGTLTGPEDAPVYRVLIGPASTKSLGGAFTCPGISVKGNQGDFFGQWSSAIGPVDFPVAGGTFTKSGTNSVGGALNRQASGSYVATPS